MELSVYRFVALAIAFAVMIYIIAFASMRSVRAETFRDNMGRVTGTAQTRGNITTFTDRMGRETGTATRQGNTTTFTDRMGREIGTATGGRK